MGGTTLRRGAWRALALVGLAGALAACHPPGSVVEEYGGPDGLALDCGTNQPAVVDAQLGGAAVAACGFPIDSQTSGYRVFSILEDGAFDTAFGDGGHVDLPHTTRNASVAGVARAPDGDVLVLALVDFGDYRLYRFEPDGTPSTAFVGPGFGSLPPTPGWARIIRANVGVTDVALHQSGELTVVAAQDNSSCGGCGVFEGLRVHTFDSTGLVGPPVTVALNDHVDPVPDGAEDVRFVFAPRAVSVAGGTVTIAGLAFTRYTWEGGENRSAEVDAGVVRLQGSALETAFGDGGLLRLDVGVDDDGQSGLGFAQDIGLVDAAIRGPVVTMAFHRWVVPGQSGFSILRLDAGGAPDTTFGGDGFVDVPVGEVLTSLTVDWRDRVLTAARSNTSPQHPVVRRLLADGTPDTEFGAGGSTTLTTVRGGSADVATPLARYFVAINGRDGTNTPVARLFRIGH